MRHLSRLAIAVSLLFASRIGLCVTPFSITDAIEMKRVTTGAVAMGSLLEQEFGLSPNGQYVVFVTRRGNTISELNEFELILMDAEEIRRYVNDVRESLPHQTSLARFESAYSEHGIYRVSWLPDSRHLTFLGTSVETQEKAQVFLVDVETRELRQLTAHSHSVLWYHFLDTAQRLVFAAKEPPDWRRRNRYGYVVGPGQGGYALRSQTTLDPESSARLIYFVKDLESNVEVRVDSEENSSEILREFWVAPNGRWAISTRPVTRIPKLWEAFDAVKTARARGFSNEYPEALGGQQATPLRQFELVDLDRGLRQPLLDSPASLRGESIEWFPDSNRVLVVGAYLPLASAAGKERDRRASTPMVLELDIGTGRVFPIAAIAVKPKQRVGEAAFFSAAAHVQRDGAVAIADFGLQGSRQHPRLFRKMKGSWKSIEGSSEINERTKFPTMPLILDPIETIQAPPDLRATDSITLRTRVVTDLNPTIRQRGLRHVDIIELTDRAGRTRRAGLLLPDDFVPGTRVPLVIQSYGFDEESSGFGLDQHLTSHPGRLFASRGIAVLQIDCDVILTESSPIGTAPDIDQTLRHRQQLCYESVVDELDVRGLVDRNKVGLIGWSKTGGEVTHVLTFSTYHWAAAVVVDAVQETLWDYLLNYGWPNVMRQWDDPSRTGLNGAFIGEQFFGEGIKQWAARSITFNVNQIRTPILFEHHGVHDACPCWETYAILKRRQLPVELHHFPMGAHNLETPAEQRISRESILDWMAFWLKDEEDPNPEKTEQYSRWRVYRQQHVARP